MKDTTELYDIDPNKLDIACIEQPKLYHDYALKFAEARAEHERAKSNLELVEAELDKEIRLEPDRFGLEKITETIVEKAIIRSKRYRTAKEKYLESKHAMDVLYAMTATLDQKKKSIEMLLQLRMNDYYSEPRIKGEAREYVDEQRMKNARKVARGEED